MVDNSMSNFEMTCFTNYGLTGIAPEYMRLFKILAPHEQSGRYATILPRNVPGESGGIGRRTGFRFQRRKACRFDSCLSHQIKQH